MADEVKDSKIEFDPNDPRAPMPSAPMQYNDDGTVAWGDMWDTYCMLALDGGPPHRGTLLTAPTHADATYPQYLEVQREIVRGIKAVSGLDATAGPPGWVAVEAGHAGYAHWLVTAITEENVEAKRDGSHVLVPCGEYFTVKGEIKNVITAVAKTTHYWGEHVPAEVKQASAAQAKMEDTVDKVKGFFGRILGS
jgi:sirohydrochlorin cobaltochelatase